MLLESLAACYSQSPWPSCSRYIKQRLQFLYQIPLVVADLGPVVLLQSVDALPRDERVERVILFQLPAVGGLVGSFDLDGNAGLPLLADLKLLVVAFDGLS